VKKNQQRELCNYMKLNMAVFICDKSMACCSSVQFGFSYWPALYTLDIMCSTHLVWHTPTHPHTHACTHTHTSTDGNLLR